MKIQLQRKPEGIAIVIVMVSIFVLAMLAGVFAYSHEGGDEARFEFQQTGAIWNALEDPGLKWLGLVLSNDENSNVP